MYTNLFTTTFERPYHHTYDETYACMQIAALARWCALHISGYIYVPTYSWYAVVHLCARSWRCAALVTVIMYSSCWMPELISVHVVEVVEYLVALCGTLTTEADLQEVGITVHAPYGDTLWCWRIVRHIYWSGWIILVSTNPCMLHIRAFGPHVCSVIIWIRQYSWRVHTYALKSSPWTQSH